MASNVKVMKSEKVLSCGSGDRRAILCYDSGLVYQYANPAKILAAYDSGRWIMGTAPYYSRGGWGNPSSGDADGAILWENAEKLLDVIGAKIMVMREVLDFTDAEEFLRVQDKADRLAKAEKALKALGLKEDLNEGRLHIDRPRYPRLTPHGKKGERKGKGEDIFKTLAVYDSALEVFLNRKGKPVTAGSYSVSPDSVTITSGGPTRTVAVRNSEGKIILNSETLPISRFESFVLGGQSTIQKKLREVADLAIPFNVLESAELDLSNTRVLEQGPQEEFSIRDGHYSTSIRHFTGALLLENGGRKFLMDVDRREIEHEIFNAFFVEVAPHVKSIAEAYESMKPQEVKDAEAAGTKVLRQGEWFFIDTGREITVDSDRAFEWGASDRDVENLEGGKHHVARAEISHGKGRPNHLLRPQRFDEETDSLVCGVVTHSGREHEPLDLGVTRESRPGNPESLGDYYGRSKITTLITYRLWKVVGNTTVANFTITGDVD